MLPIVYSVMLKILFVQGTKNKVMMFSENLNMTNFFN